MAFFTYIVHSPSQDTFYIGHTGDLAARLAEHRTHVSRFTSRAEDWHYVFYRSFDSRAEAMALEALIKSKKSRASIRRFIRHDTNECPPHRSAR